MNKLINIVYYIALLFLLSGSTIYIGPVTGGYFFCLMLLLLLLLNNSFTAFDKLMKLYLLFIFCFGLSSIVTGQINRFFDTFCRFYLVSFILWEATCYVIKQNCKAIDTIILIFLGVGLLDALVTLAQMTFQASVFDPIISFLHLRQNEEMKSVMEYQLQHNSVFSYAITGIFVNAIRNGWYLAICVCLSMTYVLKYKKIILMILPSLYLLALFACQERSALFGSLLVLIYYLVKLCKVLNTYKKSILILLFAIFAVYGIAFFVSFSSANDMRYTLGFDDTGRFDILQGVGDYINNNPIFPNIYDFMTQGGSEPHNLFLNAFMYGGIISLLCITIIFIIQTKTCLGVALKYNDNNILVVSCAMALLFFTFNSFFHNQSVVTGEFVPWLLWAIVSDSLPIKSKGLSKEQA